MTKELLKFNLKMINTTVNTILLHALARAEIMEYGLWTGNDWTDAQYDVQVINGIVSGTEERRHIQIVDATFDHPDDYWELRENVVRVDTIFGQ